MEPIAPKMPIILIIPIIYICIYIYLSICIYLYIHIYRSPHTAPSNFGPPQAEAEASGSDVTLRVPLPLKTVKGSGSRIKGSGFVV